MKKLTTMILLSVITISVISCKKNVTGEGPSITQARQVLDFNAIELGMAGDVFYKNDTARKVEIVAQQNILDMLQTYVSGNKLVIKFNGNYDYRTSSSIRINISAPSVNKFEVTTAGSIYCINTFQPASLFLKSTGSGSIKLQDVVTGNIEASTNASGSITVAGGFALSENLKTSGSGTIDLINVAAKTVTAKTSGSGNIKVKATEHLNATVEGSGSIYFMGFPEVSSHVSGTGHLIHY
ncbi:MAG: head GIN domain-containing protein [Ferruginibacter sp.]